MKNGIIIPVYRHGKACTAVVASLAPLNLPIILVDDGNETETKNYLAQIAGTYPDVVTLVTLERNSGKGGAFAAGMEKAREMGLTHVLQIDADGQHDTSSIPFFFERAAENPSALICGYPQYDETAPAHRKNGRKFANGWTNLVCWKRDIADALCGFRIYPVEETWRFTHSARFDRRMGFDIDILVRLIWRGLSYRFYPVWVTYPSDGISNFHAVRDNIRISAVFTQLCCGMILRSPVLLFRVLRRKFFAGRYYE
ncbi:MAG: glycosyltransferase family 2 protein [Treponema sp.]|nr:glycosyltransferase family 2 protein [Treponema sp.]